MPDLFRHPLSGLALASRWTRNKSGVRWRRWRRAGARFPWLSSEASMTGAVPHASSAAGRLHA